MMETSRPHYQHYKSINSTRE